MLELEDEVRKVLRDRTEAITSEHAFVAHVERRLRAKVRARRMTAAALTAALVAGAALSVGMLVSHDRGDGSIHVVNGTTAATKPSERLPLQIPPGHWAAIASPPMSGAYSSVWT